MVNEAATPRLAIAGVGSVGRRHLRNLQELGCEDIILCRSGLGGLRDETLKAFRVERDLELTFAHRPLAVIVANPSALHMPAALAAVRHGCHVFLEKPISSSLNGVAELRQEAQKRGLAISVGFQFRFHPGLRQIRQWIDFNAIGRVISAHAHLGEYLPDWHAWEDYRSSYSARSDLGGGVVLTLCHPFDYLRWLVGEVESVSAVTQKYAPLETDVEDVAQITLRFVEGATGSVYLDYVERPTTHWIQIVGEQGAIRWDNSDGIAHLYSVASRKWESFAPPDGFDRNRMFRDEMRHFLSCIAGREQPLCSLNDGVRALEIALAAKRSAAEKRWVDV